MYTWLALNSTADLAALATEIDVEYDPRGVVRKLQAGISSAVKGVLIERNYVDKDYRSTYYNFYAKKGQHYRSDCVRLHFFDGTVTFDSKTLRFNYKDPELKDHYFGYMVLRPTGIATIGRSAVSPDVRTGANGFVVTAEHKVHLLGHRLYVQAFPSMDQHIDISVCAHVACWSILRHYSEKYSTYREFLTHDITLMAQQFDPGGLVPSKGLEVSHAERVFQEAGTFPVHVPRTGPSDLSFFRQLHAYVESGFPLFAAIPSESHAIAVVGYEWESTTRPVTRTRYAWEEVKSIVVVDDNYLPYRSVPITGGTPYSATDIDDFIVALPEKIYYPADAVDLLSPTLFKLGALVGLPPKDETIVRYFITTGSALRQFMRERESEFDPKLLEVVMSLPFAQFVWVVEFATEQDWAKRQISARAVLDATASLRERNPLWLFHSRKKALVYTRRTIGADAGGALVLSGMDNTALTRWDKNLRPIQGK
ncbi:MAG: hypothetical protein WAU89_25830 [Candidatus Acidiferrales bacterium]